MSAAFARGLNNPGIKNTDLVLLGSRRTILQKWVSRAPRVGRRDSQPGAGPDPEGQRGGRANKSRTKTGSNAPNAPNADGCECGRQSECKATGKRSGTKAVIRERPSDADAAKSSRVNGGGGETHRRVTAAVPEAVRS